MMSSDLDNRLHEQLTQMIIATMNDEHYGAIFPDVDTWGANDYKEFLRLIKMRYLIQGFCNGIGCPYFYINDEWDKPMPEMEFIPPIEVPPLTEGVEN